MVFKTSNPLSCAQAKQTDGLDSKYPETIMVQKDLGLRPIFRLGTFWSYLCSYIAEGKKIQQVLLKKFKKFHELKKSYESYSICKRYFLFL